VDVHTHALERSQAAEANMDILNLELGRATIPAHGMYLLDHKFPPMTRITQLIRNVIKEAPPLSRHPSVLPGFGPTATAAPLRP
jgi:hypothetical protein